MSLKLYHCRPHCWLVPYSSLTLVPEVCGGVDNFDTSIGPDLLGQSFELREDARRMIRSERHAWVMYDRCMHESRHSGTQPSRGGCIYSAGVHSCLLRVKLITSNNKWIDLIHNPMHVCWSRTRTHACMHAPTRLPCICVLHNNLLLQEIAPKLRLAETLPVWGPPGRASPPGLRHSRGS